MSEATVAPITDEELARVASGLIGVHPWAAVAIEAQTLEQLVARLRAAEARAEKAYARGRADERADVVKWCRTTLVQNRNAQSFADAVEQAGHVTGAKNEGKGG